MGASNDSDGVNTAAIGGILLMVAAVVAFAWANSPWASIYHSIWDTQFRIGIGDYGLDKPLVLWVNDGLMAIFFLLIGLEIKREMLEGNLSSPSRAALPVFAAVGGIVVPSGIYAIMNMAEGGNMDGWPIPAATDIAFVLGILALFGKRVPLSLKVFLTAVAVVDDLGAVLIIAAFLTEGVSGQALGFAAIALLFAFAHNRMRVTATAPYLLVGAVLWLATLLSGVHATVAGVALALCIPARPKLEQERFLSSLKDSTKDLHFSEAPYAFAPDTLIHRLRPEVNNAESLLLRWEHALQPWVLFAIMPIFALANAGVVVGEGAGSSLFGPISLGVALGLMVGKPIGITLFSWIAVKSGLSKLPEGSSWMQVHAASWLAGIGFTMSLFIAGLAMDGGELTSAKLGLLGGSLIAGIVGSLLLWRSTKRKET